MKKKSLKKLAFSKSKISNLEEEAVSGAGTAGCHTCTCITCAWTCGTTALYSACGNQQCH